jgi:membrane dipeptidase
MPMRQARPLNDETRAYARELHRSATIIDSEGVCVLMPVVHIPPGPMDGCSYLDRAIGSGLTAMNITMGLGGIASGVDDFRALLNSIYGHLVYFELHPDQLVHVQTMADIDRAKREGKLGIIFGVQGFGTKMEGDITLVRILHKLGMRVIQLTNNERNPLGCGCIEKSDTGLTQLGRAAIAEMNRVGIVVDLAHAAEQTALEAFELSREPCIISHANARSLNDHYRNATDAMLKALAAKGGVIGITCYASFCRKKTGVRPNIDDVVDHIAYVADLVGIDHVGFGSDFFETESEVRFSDFANYYPSVHRGHRMDELYAVGLERVEHLPRLTESLVSRGFTDDEVKKVLGGNHRRVFEKVWRD